MARVCPGVRIVSLEADPALMVIARNVLAFAGLANVVDVWTGHSTDLLRQLHVRYTVKDNLQFRAVFMDQKGTRYIEDLEMLENQGLLLTGAVVVADNVLKPGSPLFLWRLVRSGAYDVSIVRLREFAMPSEDWMSMSVRRSQLEEVQSSEGPLPKSPKSFVESIAVPKPPKELIQLEWESDRMRAQATGQGVTYGEWDAFAEDMKARLKPFGIVATQEGGSPYMAFACSQS